MDDMIITKTLQWVESNVGDSTSKQELVSKAQNSDLPDEAKQVMQSLPEEKYSKPDLMSQLKDALIGKIGAADMAMHGFGGSM